MRFARTPSTFARARLAVPLTAAAVLLSACGSTGAVGQGTVTAVTPTQAQTASAAEVSTIIARHKAGFAAAAKAFRKCDRNVSSDSFTKSPCLKQANAETAVIDDLIADLATIQLPKVYAAIATNAKRLSAAGAAVAKRCAKVRNQKCDQALAAFRADEQSVLWDLDIQL